MAGWVDGRRKIDLTKVFSVFIHMKSNFKKDIERQINDSEIVLDIKKFKSSTGKSKQADLGNHRASSFFFRTLSMLTTFR